VTLAAFMALVSACGSQDEQSTTTDQCMISVTKVTTGLVTGIAADAGTLGGDELVQSFTADKDYSVTAVKLRLLRVGTPSGTLTLSIQGASGSGTSARPDGVDLASGTLSLSTTTISASSPTQYTFTLTSSASLAKGAVYFVRVKASYALSDTNVVKWAASDEDPLTDGFPLYETSIANSFAAIGLGTNDFGMKVCESVVED
jgi:hypothetical protein